MLAYSLALAGFLLVPPTLKAPVGPPPGFTLQEAADLFTPLAVIPASWWVVAGITPLRGRLLAVLLGICVVWIEGHGIHLAANAIGDVFAAGSPRDAFYATDAGALDHFLDEDLSHWVWHAAWVALTALMAWCAAPLRAAVRIEAGAALPRGRDVPVTALAGAVHGVTFFLVTTEGGTAGLAIPASVAFVAWAAFRMRAGSRHPVLAFVLIASVVTLGLDLGWALLNGGRLVEPCAVLGC